MAGAFEEPDAFSPGIRWSVIRMPISSACCSINFKPSAALVAVRMWKVSP